MIRRNAIVRLKITNRGSKVVTLLNGKQIWPKKTVRVETSISSDLYDHIKALERINAITVVEY